MNLYELVASRFPDDAGAVFLDPPGHEPIRYADLDDATARMRGALAAAGVKPGDRVVAQVEKSPANVVLYLACLRHGAVFVPLNTAYTATELEHVVTDAEPALLAVDPARVADAEAAAAQATSSTTMAPVWTLGADGTGSVADACVGAEPLDDTVARDDDDLAAICYTSGTTGRSKGAMLTHANLASNALVLHEAWRFVPGDVVLHALPIYHVHGLFVALHTALLNGSRVVFLPRFDPATVLAHLRGATVYMGVPTHYVRLLELAGEDGRPALDAEACAAMRLFVSGSAPLLTSTHEAFETRTGHLILERYGMTEAGMICSNPYDGDRVPGTVGFPLPGVEARVVDDAGHPVEPGVAGGLEIRGPNLFAGYWRMPERTAAEHRPDGFFVTGDLATMDETGRVTLVGRAKDLVISGGLNVYPKEVEDLIDAVPGVAESAVIGVPHPDLGEGVTALVVLEPGVSLAEADVLAALDGRLARFKQPKAVRFVDALPRNAMGKVQKALLRDAHASIYSDPA